MLSIALKIAWFALKKFFVNDVLVGAAGSLFLAGIAWVIWFLLGGLFGYDPIPFWMTARVIYAVDIATGIVYRFLWIPYVLLRDSKDFSVRWGVSLEEVVDAFLYKGLEREEGRDMTAVEFKRWCSIHDMVERVLERSPLFR